MSFYDDGEYERIIAQRIALAQQGIKTHKFIEEFVNGEIDEKAVKEKLYAEQSKPIVNELTSLKEAIAGQQSTGAHKNPSLAEYMGIINQSIEAVKQEVEKSNQPNQKSDPVIIQNNLKEAISLITDLNDNIKEFNLPQLNDISQNIGTIAQELTQLSIANDSRFELIDQGIIEIASALQQLQSNSISQESQIVDPQTLRSNNFDDNATITTGAFPQASEGEITEDLKNRYSKLNEKQKQKELKKLDKQILLAQTTATSSNTIGQLENAKKLIEDNNIDNNASSTSSSEPPPPPPLPSPVVKLTTKSKPKPKITKPTTPIKPITPEELQSAKLKTPDKDRPASKNIPVRAKSAQEQMADILTGAMKKRRGAIEAVQTKEQEKATQAVAIADAKAEKQALQMKIKTLQAKPKKTENEVLQLDNAKNKLLQLNLVITGKGVIIPNSTSYTLKDGYLGNLKVEIKNLHLVAYKGMQKVLDRKIDQSTIDLLTKAFNANKKYTPIALETYAHLLAKSNLSLNKITARVNAVRKVAQELRTTTGSGIKLFNNKADLEKRLHLIDGIRKTGNNNTKLIEEASEIKEVLNNARAK